MREHIPEKFYYCSINNCDYKVKDRSLFKYHYETSHPENAKIFGDIKCGHSNCEKVFKTHKQNIIHHNNNEVECQNEKTNLILLLQIFKLTLFNFIKNKEKNFSEYIGENIEIKDLIEFYLNVENNLFDSNYFHFKMGESFEKTPNY